MYYYWLRAVPLLSFCPLPHQSHTVLHLDLVTGAVRRLMLSQDGEPSSAKASTWWSSKEQQVGGSLPLWNFHSILLLILNMWSILFFSFVSRLYHF